MANDTFGTIWNRVLLFAPDLPPPMAQEFVRQAYNGVLNAHYWSELRADAEFLIPTAYTTGTLTATNGSTTLTGSGTSWAAAHQYQQIAIGSIAPFYTITAVGSGTSITIDREYEGATTASLTYTIGQFYVEMPTNFGSLEKIRDQSNGWYLMTQVYDQEYLDRVDSKRNSTGIATMAVAAPSRIDSSGNSIARFELWPRVVTEKLYQYRYNKNASLSSNSTRILEVLDPEVLLYGALRLAALWPGTGDIRNPYFSQATHEMYTKLYEDALHECVMNDIDLNQTMVNIADDNIRRFPFDAKYLQEHIT